MFDYEKNTQSQIDYWNQQPTDNPHLLNGFAGTWAIRDYNLIPDGLLNFLAEYFHGYTRLSRVPLEDINRVLNEVWQGPGSMSKIVQITTDLRKSRQQNNLSNAKDVFKGIDTPTIDSDLDKYELDIPEEE